MKVYPMLQLLKSNKKGKKASQKEENANVAPGTGNAGAGAITRHTAACQGNGVTMR